VLGDDGQQVKSRGLAEVEHLRAATLDDLDQSDLFQALDSLADNVAVDLKDLAEIALGGDGGSGWVTTADDLSRELLEDLVRERTLVHRLESHETTA
jgi:hypothetical protein